MSEYIKKEDALKAVSDMAYENSATIRELLTELPTYSFPDSAENKGDLISRQAVDRLVWKYLRKGTDENIAFYEHFLDLPSVENKREFERMTNGEVIKALFPNGKVIECDEATGYEQMLDEENSYCSWFDSLWWNAPYKAESEEV